MYFSNTDDKTAHIKKEFHLINDLKTKMLIEIDILTAKKITVKLKLADLVVTIESCQNINISLSVTTRLNSQINRSVIFNEYTVISLNT